MGFFKDIFSFKSNEIKNSANSEDFLMRNIADASSNVHVSETTVLGIPAVWASINIISGSVAQLPLVLYKREGESGERIAAMDHPLHKILKHLPNSYMTSYDFKQGIIMALLLHGNYYAEIFRDSQGNIISLVPILPTLVSISQNSNGSLNYEISSDGSQSKRMIPDARMFRVTGLSNDGIRGMSVMSHHRSTFEKAITTEQYGLNTLKNGAQPNTVLTYDGRFEKKETAIRMAEEFDKKFSGSNTGKTAVLQDGITLTPFGISSKDAEYIQSTKFSTEEIARIFNIPQHLIGVMGAATFSNITESNLQYVRHTLMQWLRRIEEAIYRDLLNPSEQNIYFAEFNVNALLRGDANTRNDAYSKRFSMGSISINEIRRSENEPMINEDWANQYFVPANFVSAEVAANGGSEAQQNNNLQNNNMGNDDVNT